MKGVFAGLGLLLLLAGFARCRSGNVTEYGILVMLPLSGQWEARGRAQRDGIRAAVREREGVFTGVSYVDVRPEYIDTKVRLTFAQNSVSSPHNQIRYTINMVACAIPICLHCLNFSGKQPVMRKSRQASHSSKHSTFDCYTYYPGSRYC